MTFDTEFALQEFREVEREMFDEAGKAYTGSIISYRQSEEMLKLINMLESELKNLPDINMVLQLLQDSSLQYGETYEQRAVFDSDFGDLADAIIKIFNRTEADNV